VCSTNVYPFIMMEEERPLSPLKLASCEAEWDRATRLERLTFSFVKPLCVLGSQRPLEHADLMQVSTGPGPAPPLRSFTHILISNHVSNCTRRPRLRWRAATAPPSRPRRWRRSGERSSRPPKRAAGECAVSSILTYTLKPDRPLGLTSCLPVPASPPGPLPLQAAEPLVGPVPRQPPRVLGGGVVDSP
jgi:hypothetical protein